MTPAPAPATTEPRIYRALRVVALLEGLSFVVLLVSSVLKRTTGPDVVPVTGMLHGVLFLAAVVLVLANLQRLRWGWAFTLAMLTVGSPGLHFAVHATRPALEAQPPR